MWQILRSANKKNTFEENHTIVSGGRIKWFVNVIRMINLF